MAKLTIELDEEVWLAYFKEKGMIVDPVRCKDCRNFVAHSITTPIMTSTGVYYPRDGRCNRWYGLSTDADGYCSYGERKE